MTMSITVAVAFAATGNVTIIVGTTKYYYY